MKRRFSIIALIFVILLVIGSGVAIVAWYVQNSRKADVEDIEVETPPLIYIRDDNIEEMKTFNLAGLAKGTNYQFIFCVVPAKKGTAVNFQLAVAYTGNLGMDITLYPISSVASSAGPNDSVGRVLEDKNGDIGTYYFNYDGSNPSWTTVETKKADGKNDKEENQNPNDGTRKTYKGLQFEKNGTDNPSTYLEELNDKRNYRFFVMEITWPNDSQSGSYEKEVDLIYIIARGTSLE